MSLRNRDKMIDCNFFPGGLELSRERTQWYAVDVKSDMGTEEDEG